MTLLHLNFLLTISDCDLGEEQAARPALSEPEEAQTGGGIWAGWAGLGGEDSWAGWAGSGEGGPSSPWHVLTKHG